MKQEFLLLDGSLDKSAIGDGVHPTAKGYQMQPLLMQPLLKRMLDNVG